MIKRTWLRSLLLCAFHLTAQASLGTHDIFYYFGHGLWGNAQRYTRAHFEGFFPQNKSILATNGPDYLEESLSQSISLQVINTLSWSKRIAARIYRELVLLRALRRASMAQQEDQKLAIDCIVQENRSTEDCIYVGHSKGAALGANLLQKHVFKGAILIAPFCDANKAFRDFPPLSYLPHSKIIDNYVVPCLRYFLLPKYNSKDSQPFDFTEHSPNVAPQTPILIVSIKGDRLVPQYHQIELYMKLKRTGHNVYFYELPSADHDKLAFGPDSPAHQEFISVIQAFQEYIYKGVHTALHDDPTRPSPSTAYSSPSIITSDLLNVD